MTARMLIMNIATVKLRFTPASSPRPIYSEQLALPPVLNTPAITEISKEIGLVSPNAETHVSPNI